MFVILPCELRTSTLPRLPLPPEGTKNDFAIIPVRELAQVGHFCVTSREREPGAPAGNFARGGGCLLARLVGKICCGFAAGCRRRTPECRTLSHALTAALQHIRTQAGSRGRVSRIVQPWEHLQACAKLGREDARSEPWHPAEGPSVGKNASVTLRPAAGKTSPASGRHRVKLAQSLGGKPCLRHTSAVFIPASCSCRIAMICSSVNRSSSCPVCLRAASTQNWPSFPGSGQAQ
jgi:hypothetical protein